MRASEANDFITQIADIEVSVGRGIDLDDETLVRLRFRKNHEITMYSSLAN
ncbi:MAG: hypothetical protein ABR910_00020 [Acidobacteriaceae bacterium]